MSRIIIKTREDSDRCYFVGGRCPSSIYKKIPSNTVEAFEECLACRFHYTIIVRKTKNSTLVCFKRFYIRKAALFGLKRVSKVEYAELTKIVENRTTYRVPTLEEALEITKAKAAICLELRGTFSKEECKELVGMIDNYKERYFTKNTECMNFGRKIIIPIVDPEFYQSGMQIRTANLFNYYRLKDKLGEQLTLTTFHLKENLKYWLLQARERIEYSPAFGQLKAETDSSRETILKALYTLSNSAKSRIKEDHWLLQQVLLHRGIINEKYPENSAPGVQAVIDQNAKDGIKRAVEIDIDYLNGNIVCYHNDKISDKIGQPKSIASKDKKESVILLQDLLNNTIQGKLNVILDFKFITFRPKTVRRIVKQVMDIVLSYLEDFSVSDDTIVLESFNPLILRQIAKNYPSFIRLIVGNSFSNLKTFKRTVKTVVSAFSFTLRYFDGVVFDNGAGTKYLSQLQRLMGYKVIAYSGLTEEEIRDGALYADNMMTEGMWIPLEMMKEEKKRIQNRKKELYSAYS